MDSQHSKVYRKKIGSGSKRAATLLRLALAITYIWFGALKISGVSPVADLVAKTTPFLPKKTAVPLVGVLEVAIGFGLLFRVAMRLTMPLFFFQIACTFLVPIMRPREAFQKGNPLLLTDTGEFVMKNLVLLAAGVVVGSTSRDKREGKVSYSKV